MQASLESFPNTHSGSFILAESLHTMMSADTLQVTGRYAFLGAFEV